MQNFSTFDLPKPLTKALERLKFETPTPVQLATIPLALEGQDVLGSAQTGTGKTGAFGIPLVAGLLNNPEGTALVITPTRELATQVMQALRDFLGHDSPIKTALIIGGEPMPKQLQQLKKGPRLFVGTPGRLNDHLRRGSINLSKTNYLVLDETDRMLDMGFSVQIEEIQKHLPKERQTLLFSATLPKNIMNLAGSYLNNPQRVAIGSTIDPAKNIKQEVLQVSDADKYPELLEQLEKRKGSVIIFVKTKYGTEKMAKKLATEGHDTDALHGDLRHSRRERVIKAFRNRKYRVLVATDVAARGLDIPHIEHVINYDLPQAPEDYIHRIGRTARAGAEGEAICFVSPSERGKWHAIDRLMNPNAAREEGPRRGSGGGKGRFEKRSGGFGKKTYDRHSRGERPAHNDRYSRTDRSSKPAWAKSDRPSRDDKPSWNRSDRPAHDGKSVWDRSERSSRDSKPSWSKTQRAARDGKPSWGKSERPARDGKPSWNNSERPARDGKPSWNKSERPFRDGKPSWNKSERPARDGKPSWSKDQRSARDGRPSGGRPSGGKPSFGNRDSGGDRFARDERPARSNRPAGNKKPSFGGDRPQRPGAKNKPFAKKRG